MINIVEYFDRGSSTIAMHSGLHMQSMASLCLSPWTKHMASFYLTFHEVSDMDIKDAHSHLKGRVIRTQCWPQQQHERMHLYFASSESCRSRWSWNNTGLELPLKSALHLASRRPGTETIKGVAESFRDALRLRDWFQKGLLVSVRWPLSAYAGALTCITTGLCSYSIVNYRASIYKDSI